MELRDSLGRSLFHVWTVRTVDEGIEILTGVPAGRLSPNGHFPEGTVNCLVEEKMRQYARLLRQEGRETHRHA